ncbi:nuclear transport factor 2B-like isoform X3 [Zingiber officinale]|uniref:nuclear transport factor 2B-like isoform X3 n=1 Tax=Zingiber officinale TaxID=94328 RepID=UPI001C4D83C2|nr:nuclear transport factor 2B-like isoform X3 [Zingiber officinale]
MDTYAIFKDYRLLFDVFGRAFAEHYYRTFESNPQALVGLYLDYSMLTFEGEKIQGAAAIVSKLTSHPFQQCAHAISTVDCQPSGFSGGVLVVVNGFLLLGGEQHPRMFSQDTHVILYMSLLDLGLISTWILCLICHVRSKTFQLVPTPQGSFCVLNDMFRLNGWITAGPPV